MKMTKNHSPPVSPSMRASLARADGGEGWPSKQLAAEFRMRERSWAVMPDADACYISLARPA